MPTKGLAESDRILHESDEWLCDIASAMGGFSRQVAYHALRGVLFAIRDRLPVHEALHFSAQLPVMIRGIFFEAYRASGKPEASRRAEFLDHVSHELQKVGDVNPEVAARAVFTVLQRRLSEGEVADIRDSLPRDLLSLWPRASAGEAGTLAPSA